MNSAVPLNSDSVKPWDWRNVELDLLTFDVSTERTTVSSYCQRSENRSCKQTAAKELEEATAADTDVWIGMKSMF